MQYAATAPPGRRAPLVLALAAALVLPAGPVDAAAPADTAAHAAAAHADTTAPGRSAASALPASPPAADRDFLFGPPNGSFGVRGGLNLARASSDLFDEVTGLLTLDRGDFDAATLGFDFALRVHERVDAVVGVGFARAAASSHFRDWQDTEENEIEQETRLTQAPLTLGAKLYLTPPGRQIGEFAWIPARLTPYVGASGGAVWYRFEQEGDFVDFETLDIYTLRLASEGWAPTGHLFGGVDVRLGPATVLTAEARYAAARPDPSGSTDGFASYDAIDLSGLQATLGLRLRF